jgi:hypothetical protein
MISFTVTIASFLVVLNKGGILSETLSEGQSEKKRALTQFRVQTLVCASISGEICSLKAEL